MSTMDEMLKNLVEEPMPDSVFDSSDKFPPRWQPGTKVRFVFKLEPDTKKQKTVDVSEDNTRVRVRFMGEATHVITKDGEIPVPQTSNGNPVTLRFQQVDNRTFKNQDGTIVPSSLQKLFRALVGKDAAKLTGTASALIIEKLRELDGKESFDGMIGWVLKTKNDEETVFTAYSTATRKRKEYERDGKTNIYEPWPVDGNGENAKMIEDQFPRDFISGFVEKKVAPVAETVQG